MLRIVTTTGNEIDVRPGNTIEFEMENPIFQSDYIPTTFSTSFQFPPSDRNKTLLGYLPALKMPPSVKKIDVSLVLDGIEIASGMMEYEGIKEDSGDLEYTFSCKSVEDVLSQKIHEVSYVYSRENVEVVTQSQAASAKSFVATKMPAIKISDILGRIDALDMETIDDIRILATYGDANTLPISLRLPDVTFLELLKSTAKLFCMALFVNGDRYSLKYIKDILLSSEFIDWSTKVSDRFEAGRMKARGYKIEFANTDINPSENAAASVDAGITTVSYLKTMISGISMGEYRAYRVSAEGGDVFSITMTQTTIPDGSRVYKRLVDIVEHAGNSHIEAGNDPFDSSPAFKLAECTPYEYLSGTYVSQLKREWRMAPVFSKIDTTTRSSEMIIGESRNSQFVDKRATFYPLLPEDNTDGEAQYANMDHLWTAERVYNRFHLRFASMLKKDRQTINAELNLTAQDLSSFRLWQKVRFSNREWLVKKLTFTILTSRGIISSRGEFVEI